ncbi:MAG: pilus assembly protein [Acidimicrobiia bacterium]|nr:pilus assembly protein [Acidimicrobiia bacterium]
MRLFRHHRGERRERGAASVEMAIVAPLLVLLVFGIFEYGLLFREKLTIASAATSSARTGATMGTRADADYRILQALEAGLYDQVDSGVLIRVDIFEANPNTGTKTGKQDSYAYDPDGLVCKWSPCPDPVAGSGATGSWLPADRDVVLLPGGGGLDVLGVEVVYHHYAIGGLVPGVEGDFSERALVRLEPSVFGTTP